MSLRKEEFEKVKEIIKNYSWADCGIFDCRNLCGDLMYILFNGEYFQIDICPEWFYFEVFGTTEKEFRELRHFYENLVEGESNISV